MIFNDEFQSKSGHSGVTLKCLFLLVFSKTKLVEAECDVVLCGKICSRSADSLSIGIERKLLFKNIHCI